MTKGSSFFDCRKELRLWLNSKDKILPSERWRQPAEGETEPTVVAVRRVDVSRIEVQVVGIGASRIGSRRPTESIDASIV